VNTDWIEKIHRISEEKQRLLNTLKDCGYYEELLSVAEMMTETLRSGGRIFTAGNGGSAADAQHFTGEIVGRFLKDREPLPSVSLVTDPVVVTSVANDYGYDSVFERQLSGLGKKGDILLAISTSGNSENLNRAVIKAGEMGMVSVGLTGRDGGRLRELCRMTLIVPSGSTPRIQEIHTFTVHMLCEIIEKELFG